MVWVRITRRRKARRFCFDVERPSVSLPDPLEPSDFRTQYGINDYNNLRGREGPILGPFPPPLIKEKQFS